MASSDVSLTGVTFTEIVPIKIEKDGTRATKLMDENLEDHSNSLIPWTQPWCGGTRFPLVDEELYHLDTPAGLVEMRTTKWRQRRVYRKVRLVERTELA